MNNIDIEVVKNLVDKHINWDNYNTSKRRNYRNRIMKEYKKDDLIIELSYLLYLKMHNNNINPIVSEEKISRDNLVKDNVPNIDLSNYVSKKKYDKVVKEFKEYKEQNDSLMECYENKINEYKEEIFNLKQKIKKLDKSSFEIMNEEELKEQNEELLEENQKYLDIIIKHNLSHLI
jgi:hypothetical protein